MTLLLTSNGMKGSIDDIFPTLLIKPPQENKVAFITTAAYGEDEDISWLEKYREELLKHGITDILDVDLKSVQHEKLAKILEESDICFVNGGNTFYLLYYVRESGFDTLLTKFLRDGKLYVGVSAGSIICSPNIEIASLDLSVEFPADKNSIGLTDFRGLSYVPFLLSPHYEVSQERLMTEESVKTPLPLVALTDVQALLVQNNETALVGDGERIIFVNGTKTDHIEHI